MLLHNGQNLDDDLGGRSDQDLSLSSSLGVDDVVQAVVENGDSDHFEGFLKGSVEWMKVSWLSDEHGGSMDILS